MKYVYYAGMFAGAFMLFRFEDTPEFIGAAILVAAAIAETARALKENS